MGEIIDLFDESYLDKYPKVLKECGEEGHTVMVEIICIDDLSAEDKKRYSRQAAIKERMEKNNGISRSNQAVANPS
jgi:hypothetical protein